MSYVHRRIWLINIACDRQMALGAPVVPELAKIKATVSLVSSMTGGLYTHETKKQNKFIVIFSLSRKKYKT